MQMVSNSNDENDNSNTNKQINKQQQQQPQFCLSFGLGKNEKCQSKEGQKKTIKFFSALALSSFWSKNISCHPFISVDVGARNRNIKWSSKSHGHISKWHKNIIPCFARSHINTSLMSIPKFNENTIIDFHKIWNMHKKRKYDHKMNDEKLFACRLEQQKNNEWKSYYSMVKITKTITTEPYIGMLGIFFIARCH